MSSDQNDPATRQPPPWPARGVAQTPDTAPVLHQVRPELLSSLSHELRTPLHTLNGFLEIVLDYDVGPLTEQQREYLTYARASAQQLTTLIEDGFILLRGDDSSRLQQAEDISLVMLLDAAAQTTTLISAHKRVHLVREIPGNPPRVRADRSRLQLAIQSTLAAVLDSAEEETSCSIQVVTRNHSVDCVITAQIASARVEYMRALADMVEERAMEAHFDSRGVQLAAARLIMRQHQGTFSLAVEQTGQCTVRFALPSA